ncbi:MAG TPA: pyridoxal-phosphate dependent enzyme [Taishania sp.]|nr:pyridoxal-phosphate dependent enzyme [Taishania sp.]HNS42972.1 pyridoxal-phosphate dependent enzyme [Taishania sp.]
MPFDTSKSIIQTLSIEEFDKRGIQLLVKRDDLIHPEVSGNKWRKLKYTIEHFKQSKCSRILTFGGAYSNHLLATASACNELNIPSIGVVRGDEHTPHSNYVLSRCKELGMFLYFVSREEYAMRYMTEYHQELHNLFPNTYIVNEGGASYYGMIGCQEIIGELPPFDHLFVSQGTSTTSCGLLLGLSGQQLHVVPSIKNYDSKGEMKALLLKSTINDDLIEELLQTIEVHGDYHFGGYAKQTPALFDFIDSCEKNLQLPLDKIYTAKAFYGMLEELRKSDKYDNSTVVFLHTGGLYKG